MPDKSFTEKPDQIRKHSIVKIDPKTLKPISERAPDSSNLSNLSDLKINTSSVSIFNPLKLQASSPKSDRKSPKTERKTSEKLDGKYSGDGCKSDFLEGKYGIFLIN